MQRRINRRWLVLGAAALVVAVLIGIAYALRPSPKPVDLTNTINRIERGDAVKVDLSPDGRIAEVTFQDESTSRVVLPPDQTFTELLYQAQVPREHWPPINAPQSGSNLPEGVSLLLRVGTFLLLGALVFFLFRRLGPGSFGSSGSRRGAFEPVRAGERVITFDDVAGSEEIKEEVSDIVDFLRDPERYRQLGARIPRGVLLAGQPGTGKTLLARALAGEANASFFSVSGSEFVELYVGVGASRVRDLFRRAKEAAPSIVFIDEIDAIGRRRGRMEQSSEYDQTLNQILVEMDGFHERTTVVVVAATNRIDILDSALLRPGRFDRKVTVDLPDRRAREAILEVHARGKPFAEDVVLDEIAARTTGMTGADLANIINEAAILAARARRALIGMKDLLEALDRTIAGPARNARRFTDQERRVVAYHEAGHAVVAHLLPNADPVRKVSIVSRGQAGGFTMIVPEQDRGLWTRKQLNDRLAALLGGMAAEELSFSDVTTGSSNDLEQVTSIASSMVQRYGMSKRFGLLSTGNGNGELAHLSPQTAYAAEQETLEIVESAHATALSVLQTHRGDLERVAQRLLEVETIEGDELSEIIKAPRGVSIPAKSPSLTRPLTHPVPSSNGRQPNGAGLFGRAATAVAAVARGAVVAAMRQSKPEADRT